MSIELVPFYLYSIGSLCFLVGSLWTIVEKSL
jgi:hypothetical protein